MSFADWQKRSKLFTNLYGRFERAELSIIRTACQAAYEAGERQGRKDVEALAKQAITLRTVADAARQQQEEP